MIPHIVISRKQALKLGVKTYFTGKPCKHGHVSERLTVNLTCSECNRVKAKRWAQENKDRAKARFEKWYSNPENAASVVQHARSWAKQNRAQVRETGAVARAHRKKRHIPLSKAHRKELRRIYRECPPGHQVDHIIPLRGKLVSGLHVPWNLQYLTEDQNRRKSNRFEPADLVTSP